MKIEGGAAATALVALLASLLGGCDGGKVADGNNVASDCIRPLVSGPDSSGATAIGAELDGEWPADTTVYASVTFVGSPELFEFQDSGDTVYVSNGAGDSVSSAKVWVAGPDGWAVRCNLWMRR